jgi:hypothetical protein
MNDGSEELVGKESSRISLGAVRERKWRNLACSVMSDFDHVGEQN